MYKILDYGNRAGLAVPLIIVLIFVIVPVLYLAFFGAYKLRLLLYKEIMSRTMYTVNATNAVAAGDTEKAHEETRLQVDCADHQL